MYTNELLKHYVAETQHCRSFTKRNFERRM